MMVLVGLMVMQMVGVGWVLSYVILFISYLFVLLEMNFEWAELHYIFIGVGGDLMSFGFVLLSFWLVMMMGLVVIKLESCGLMVLYFFMIFFLSGVFLSIDFFLFYLMFEAVLIPTFILILGWGYQPERLSAGLFMLFYTVFCSMPLLLIILLMKSYEGSMSIHGGEGASLNFMSGVFVMAGFLAFLVKVPVYGFHLWLPKAHVEAPVGGSMVLAGVLLKLGGYGMMRFSFFCWGVMKEISGILIILSLVGGIYLGCVCLRQSDVSALIAYSSVVHMGFVIGGIFSGYVVGWEGAYVLMVGHGLCSSGLFYFAGVNYERIGSRSMFINSGLMSIFPSMVMLWFFFVSSNMAFPPSLNLLGEIMLLGSLISFNMWVMGVLFFVSILGGVYCLYLYSWVQHGGWSGLFSGGEGVSVSESLISMMHWLPLNCLFLSGDLFMV